MSAVLEPAIEISRQEWANRAIEFVRSIGIPVSTTDSEEVASAFVPYCRVKGGGLMVNPEKVFPGDIIHEAGHIAVIPSRFRPSASGTFGKSLREMKDYMDANANAIGRFPEDPTLRGIMQSGEAEATAWQYAAAQHIGLPDEWLFPPGSFEGNGEENLMRLKANSYMGINGLQAAGWTKVREISRLELPTFPKLAFWLYP